MSTSNRGSKRIRETGSAGGHLRETLPRERVPLPLARRVRSFSTTMAWLMSSWPLTTRYSPWDPKALLNCSEVCDQRSEGEEG